jgi:hypothetical protein
VQDTTAPPTAAPSALATAPSSSPAASATWPASTEGSPSTPWPLSSAAAEALFAAAEAKRNLLAAEDVLSRCTAHLSQLVDLGVLVPKGLPVVAGFVLFQNEGRRSFTYPEEIKAMEAGVRKHKKLAEQLGTAIEKVGEPYWTIRPDTATQGPAL